MSARTFYQTFYQTDSLYRLADDSWDVFTPMADVVEEPLHAQEANLLAELDTLSKQLTAPVEPPQVEADLVETFHSEPLEPDPVPVEPIAITPIQGSAPSKPVVVITSPEPLPQSVPRPKTPSLLPPTQQPRLPQLNHKVLLLADEVLDPSNLLFLEKILKAVNLNVNGVDLLNLHGSKDLDFAELLRGKYIHHFITFGVPFERINLDIMMDRYAPVRFEGITFLMADSLPTIEADQQLKKRLWGALQRIFLQR